MTLEVNENDLAHYTRLAGGSPVADWRDQEIKFKAIVPEPIEKIIDLVELFERTKLHKADAWQIDFCNRLQEAFFNRHIERTLAMVHAEAQLGKSVILAQVYAAWILGHDPMHRVALATYNITRSQSHSKAVIAMMNLPVYRKIFRDPNAHVKRNISKERWQTPARAGLVIGADEDQTVDAQDSFNPVGLQSGLTGSGFDTLIIDDPYADQEEAFSETTRATLQNFWEYTVTSRLSPYANVFGMFHRYHVQDLAGYLLDKGTFDYWRYASIADGDYIHSETGQKFTDPLGREKGELISPERRGLSYYADKQKNINVWHSMFQGRPNAEEGGFFKVGMLKKITPAEGFERLRESSIVVRGWDNAATKEGGDWTAGVKIGMRRDKSFTILHAEMLQAESEDRYATLKRVAKDDGRNTVVTNPQDPGSAGKDVAARTVRELEGYTVVIRGTSQNKQERARNFSSGVNSGMGEYVSDDDLPPEKKWNKQFLRALQEFPLSTFDDPVDGGSDAYNTADEMLARGTLIKNYIPTKNLMLWNTFASKFGRPGTNGHTGDIVPCKKVPRNFTVYVGVKISPDASLPNSAVIVARAPQVANMPDKLFIVAEYKAWTDDYFKCFDWIERATAAFCEDPKPSIIWLHAKSEQYKQVIWQKLGVPVAMFEGDEFNGFSELDWHMLPTGGVSPFGLPDDTRLYGLIHDKDQLADATDEFGLVAFRQECLTAGLNEKGLPSGVAQVLDCVRMVTYAFRTVSAPLTKGEQVEAALAPVLRAETIAAMPDSHEKDSAMTRRNLEVAKIEKDLDKPVRGPHSAKFARR